MKDLNIYFIGPYAYEGIKSSTIEECYEYLSNKREISLDIETTQKYGGRFEKEGLDPYVSSIVMIQIGDKDRQYVIDYRSVNVALIQLLLEDPAIEIIGQNLKFEYKFLFHHLGIRINNLYDTMIVEQILFNGLNPLISLKELNKKYLNIEVDKDTRLEFLKIGLIPFTEKQIIYGAQDILYPMLIRDYQLEDIEKKDVANCVKLEMLFLPVVGDIEYKGIHFDTQLWTETYNINIKIVQKIENSLNNYILDYHPKSQWVTEELDLFEGEVIFCNINWNSSQQVVEFFEFLNICPKEVSTTTKLLRGTVNAGVLRASLNTINLSIEAHKKELILTYLKYKESQQSCNTFGIKFFKYINPITKRLHSNYRQILQTGRISSSGPNLQNIPADLNFRRAFNAPAGYKIVNADYSGQEQIILANKSQDKDLLYFYEQGLGDMHSYIASKIFPELADLSLKQIKAEHKDKRQIAKAAGFAINYGGNGYTISKNLGVDISIGDAVYNAYFKAFPGLKKYFKQVQQTSLQRGYILIDPLSGRKNWFFHPKTNKEKGKIERNALNYPIQGEAGGITKLAPVLFREWILEQGLEDVISITNLVHDEINLEVKEEYAALAAENLERCMKEAGDKWCKVIPLEADAVITDFWNH
tara:strand:- start:67237 stop:69165 length:1929 start_codon:yes stop_codon:yes gene_type:complete